MNTFTRLSAICFHSRLRFFSSNSVPRNTSLRSRSRRYLAVGGLSLSTAAGFWWCFGGHDQLQILSLYSFAPAEIRSSERVGSRSRLIRLKAAAKSLPEILSFPPPIWSIFIKDSDIQIERPFTPLEGISADGEMMLWVKRYPDSEMGNWLQTRPIGDSIDIRGPHQTWLWKDGTWDKVIMIAGGTGITPFHQLLHHVFEPEEGNATSTNFTLLHAYRSVDELPPESCMRNLSKWTGGNPDKLKVVTFVEDLSNKSDSVALKRGRISKVDIQSALQEDSLSSSSTIVLICGPESMVNVIAGSKNRDGSQGPVGGLLCELPGNFKVWKL